MYVEPQDIIKEYKLKPKQFGFNNDNKTELTKLITKWILQATSAINEYLNKTTPYPDENIPGIIQLACTEAVGNIIINRRLRQDGSYIKSDDWTKEIVAPLDILDGVRELLEPLTKEEQRYNNAHITCFAVTNNDLKKERREGSE